jgi:hypothetical protein
MGRTAIGTRRLNKRDNRYSDTHTRAIETLNSEKGSPPPVNPELAVNTLRQMEKWGRQSLLHAGTKLYCAEHGVRKVKDAFPDGTALLECGCRRAIHQITEERYAEVVQVALSSKIVRSPLGGHEVISAGEAQ